MLQLSPLEFSLQKYSVGIQALELGMFLDVLLPHLPWVHWEATGTCPLGGDGSGQR